MCVYLHVNLSTWAQVLTEARVSDPLELELQTLWAAWCELWKLNSVFCKSSAHTLNHWAIITAHTMRTLQYWRGLRGWFSGSTYCQAYPHSWRRKTKSYKCPLTSPLKLWHVYHVLPPINKQINKILGKKMNTVVSEKIFHADEKPELISWK